VRHRQTKGSATDRLRLNHRATPRLHKLEFILTGTAFNRTYTIGFELPPTDPSSSRL
jgi:hypothetical protein